jgi:tetratricopeptide (TPR) repeat protein
VITPLPPLQAYQRDRAAGATRGREHIVGQSLAAALLLQRYVGATATERERLEPFLLDALAECEVAPNCRDSRESIVARTPPTTGTLAPLGRDLARRLEDSSALHLSYSVLTLLGAVSGADPREQGRLLAQRGRVSRQLGDLEAAADLYDQVAELGTMLNDTELRARASIGHGVVSQLRGNYPNARSHYANAARHADEAGLDELSGLAHQGLMVSAAIAEDFDRALAEGWTAFRMVARDSNAAAEMLVNVAQLLADLGHDRPALYGFSAALLRTSTQHVVLAALGGLATSAARLGIEPLVREAAQRIGELARSAAFPYPVASALLDLSMAYATLGDAESLESTRVRVLETARAYGFHEIELRAEGVSVRRPPPAVPTTRTELGPEASEIAAAIERLGDPHVLHGSP